MRSQSEFKTDCDASRAHLNDFLDGMLAADQAQTLTMHLKECADCRTEYQALKSTQEMLRVAVVPDSGAARQRVMARFRQSMGTEKATTSIRSTERQEERGLPVVMRLLNARRWRSKLLPWGTAFAAAGVLGFFVLSPFRHTSDLNTMSNQPIVVATAACNPTLPSAADLDQMESAHAIQSFTVQNGNEEQQQETLADANSRLAAVHSRQ